MTIILKLNTFVRDSSPNQIGTALSRRISHTTQSDHRQTTAMGSRLLCDALFVPQHHSHKLVTSRTPSMHEERASSLLGSKVVPNNTQLCRRKSKPGGRTLGSTIRSPLTGSDADHAAVQASGTEKGVVDGSESKFHTDLRESSLLSGISNICSYMRELACLLQFTSSRTVVASRRSFGGAMFASTGN
jgi:hypothetical protein